MSEQGRIGARRPGEDELGGSARAEPKTRPPALPVGTFELGDRCAVLFADQEPDGMVHHLSLLRNELHLGHERRLGDAGVVDEAAVFVGLAELAVVAAVRPTCIGSKLSAGNRAAPSPVVSAAGWRTQR